MNRNDYQTERVFSHYLKSFLNVFLSRVPSMNGSRTGNVPPASWPHNEHSRIQHLFFLSIELMKLTITTCIRSYIISSDVKYMK